MAVVCDISCPRDELQIPGIRRKRQRRGLGTKLSRCQVARSSHCERESQRGAHYGKPGFSHGEPPLRGQGNALKSDHFDTLWLLFVAGGLTENSPRAAGLSAASSSCRGE